MKYLIFFFTSLSYLFLTGCGGPEVDKTSDTHNTSQMVFERPPLDMPPDFMIHPPASNPKDVTQFVSPHIETVPSGETNSQTDTQVSPPSKKNAKKAAAMPRKPDVKRSMTPQRTADVFPDQDSVHKRPVTFMEVLAKQS